MKFARTTLLAAAAIAALAAAPSASAIDKVDTKKLRKGVTVDGIVDHARAFQDIANANGGNRAATTDGYDASAAYVARKMRAAGYKVSIDKFDFPIFTLNGPSTLEQLTPAAKTFVEDTDYIVAQFSGAGDLTAQIVPTNDITIPVEAGTGTSGCEASDFPPATAGNIALIQRGTCPFTDKYANAKAAGAAGVLIFNDGGEGREEPLPTTATPNIGIPTAMTSNDAGEALYADAQAGGATARIAVDATTTPNEEINVIADSRAGNPNRTIVVGAHLDSVEEGPGINDNGSGSGGTLAIAEQIAKLKQDPRNRIRFAWWGAEEAGLVGSTAYVQEQVANGTADQIEANLNFDMIGSPNFARFVYDGDNSLGEGSVGPAGSAQIEQLFNSYFAKKVLDTAPTAFDGRSDYGEFILNGIPAGGLFSGAEGVKTPEEEAIFGGTAGLAYDPCYHEACDTIFNLSRTSLNQLGDAAAHATWTLARSKSPITTFKGGGATAAKASKGKRMRYSGPFRTR